MSKKTVTRLLILFLAMLPCCFFGFWYAVAASSNEGSPALAVEWRDHLAQFPDPVAARANDPEVIVLRFENGEWVFGRTQSSHGIWRQGRGTMVVRDSSGRTRAFFGHVCGSGHLAPFNPDLPDLAEFYEQLRKNKFTEHPLP